MDRIAKSAHLIELDRGGKLLLADRDFLIPFVCDNSVSIHKVLDAIVANHELGYVSHGEIIDLFQSVGILKPGTSAQTPTKAVEDVIENVELHLLMVQGCNINCVYCYNGSSSYKKDRPTRFMAEDALALISRLRAIHDPSVTITVHFFGGEPLLNWREIIKIVEGISNLADNVRFYVTSNLTLLPEPLVSAFVGTDVIFDVTVDGPASVHNRSRIKLTRSGPEGTFEAVTANIARLIGRQITVAAKMVLSKFNQNRIEETIKIHHALGAKTSSVTLMRSSDSDGDSIDLLASPAIVREEMERLARMYCDGDIVFDPATKIEAMLLRGVRMEQYCGAGVDHSAVVDNEGNAYNCAWFVGDESYRVGKWKDGGMQEMADVDQSFRNQARIDRNGGCHECNYRYVCGGPCPATRIKNRGVEGWNAFQREREIKCAVTKPILNALLWKHASVSV